MKPNIYLKLSLVINICYMIVFQPEQGDRDRKLALSPIPKEKDGVATDDNSMLVLLSLTYLKTAERLTVTINRARNLPLADRKGRLGIFHDFSCSV